MPWCRNAIKANLGISCGFSVLFAWLNWRLKISFLDPERIYGSSYLHRT